jgi:IS5 family transposase
LPVGRRLVHRRARSHLKVRYRGLVKNTQQPHTLFALSNLWMMRGRLMDETIA